MRNTHVVLRKALADAEKIGLVPRNVAAATNPPVPGKPDHVTWSTDDLVTFLNAIPGDPLEIAYHLLAATGMRRGEVVGLRWRDVDLDLGENSVGPHDHRGERLGWYRTASGDPVNSAP